MRHHHPHGRNRRTQALLVPRLPGVKRKMKNPQWLIMRSDDLDTDQNIVK